jgi:RHS repeat-associated protein
VTYLDSNTNGYIWSSVYDGLGRRLSTTTIFVTNGVALSNLAATIYQYYDPNVPFLEIGETDSGNTTWKFYGPDANGVYGGMQGMGGLEAVVNGPRESTPVISDLRGNALGLYNVSQASVTLFPSRVTAYGSVPGYAPLALADGAKVAQASAWRGKWSDITGLIYLGNRYYDPVAGNWFSFDPAWNERDPNGFTFCGGDPANYFDPTGAGNNPVGSETLGPSTTPSLPFAPVNPTQSTSVSPTESPTETSTSLASPFVSETTGENTGGGTSWLQEAEEQWGIDTSYTAERQTDQALTSFVNTATFGLASDASVAFSGADLNGNAVYGAERGIAAASLGLALIPVGDVGEAAGTVAAELGEKIGIDAAENGAFANYMRQAQTLDVSTAPNTAVFYSGPGNRALAEGFATANGGTTLEMTPGGAWLDQQQLFNTAQSGLTTEQAAQVWSTLSQRFAQGASGNAFGFVNGARAGGIFNTVEYPALLNNPNVVNVITGGH